MNRMAAQLVILPKSKSWHLHIHIALLSSAGGGNLYDVLSVALKGAVYDLRIPKTRQIEHINPHSANKPGEASLGDKADDDAEGGGMEALLKRRKTTKNKKGGPNSRADNTAADFELLDYEGDAGLPLRDRDDFPLSLTLNLVRETPHKRLMRLLSHTNVQTPHANEPFLDATLFESLTVPARLICNADSKGRLRSLKQEIPDGSVCDAPNEIPYDRIDSLLDVGDWLRLSLALLNRLLQTSEGLLSALHANVNQRLQDPQTSQAGVRLAAFP